MPTRPRLDGAFSVFATTFTAVKIGFFTLVVLTVCSPGVASAQASLADLVKQADSVFLAKVVAASIKNNGTIMTSERRPVPTAVVLEVIDKLKGSYENQTQVEVLLPDTLVAEGQTVLWFLPKIPATRKVRPLIPNGNMRVSPDSLNPQMLVAFGENKNRGLWGNKEGDSLWKLVNQTKFWDEYRDQGQSPDVKNRVKDIAGRSCTPNPVPYELLRAAIRVLDDTGESKHPH